MICLVFFLDQNHMLIRYRFHAYKILSCYFAHYFGPKEGSPLSLDKVLYHFIALGNSAICIKGYQTYKQTTYIQDLTTSYSLNVSICTNIKHHMYLQVSKKHRKSNVSHVEHISKHLRKSVNIPTFGVCTKLIYKQIPSNSGRIQEQSIVDTARQPSCSPP